MSRLLLLVVCAAMCAGCSAEPSPTPAVTVTVTAVEPLPDQVNNAVAGDGTPLVLPHGLYSDAYGVIADDCATMEAPPAGMDAAGWLAAHVANAILPGEIRALQVAVPLACPQFTSALSVINGGG